MIYIHKAIVVKLLFPSLPYVGYLKLTYRCAYQGQLENTFASELFFTDRRPSLMLTLTSASFVKCFSSSICSCARGRTIANVMAVTQVLVEPGSRAKHNCTDGRFDPDTK